MYRLVFFGDDGEFEYTIAQTDIIEYLFRYPRVHGLAWTFDGDGWTSQKQWFEGIHWGAYYVGRP